MHKKNLQFSPLLVCLCPRWFLFLARLVESPRWFLFLGGFLVWARFLFLGGVYSLLPHLPMPHCCHLTFCAAWVRRHAHWAGDKYSSWFLPPSLSPNGILGHWCSDWTLLLTHTTTVRHPDHGCPQWEDVCVCVCEQVGTHVSRDVHRDTSGHVSSAAGS